MNQKNITEYQEDSNESDRIKVISAIIADNKFRYAGTSTPQKSGRFNIPLKCVNILNPKIGEEFVIIKDDFGGTGSVIITREKLITQDDIVLSRVKFGTGKKKIKKRIRLNQRLASMFGVCELGFSACDFRGALSLRVSPRVPDPDLNILKAQSVEELAKYVLWPGRSLRLITIANQKNLLPIAHPITFKLLGGYYFIRRHSVQQSKGNDICKLRNCKYCKENNIVENNNPTAGNGNIPYPAYYHAYYIPILADINSNHPRPMLLKFTGQAAWACVNLIIEINNFIKENNSTYWSGPVKYNNKSIWMLSNDYVEGRIAITQTKEERELTDSEKGWALSLRKKFKKIISDKENIRINDIVLNYRPKISD